jgi:hypothetical protein
MDIDRYCYSLDSQVLLVVADAVAVADAVVDIVPD